MKPPFIVAFIVILSALFSQAACSKKKPAGETDVNTAVSGTTQEEDRARANIFVESGRELYRTDQDDKAVAAFQEAIKLDPDSAEAYFRLGLAYDAVRKQSEAEEAYEKAIERYKKHLETNPKDAEGHYNLGQAYAGLRLHSEAVREYRQAAHLKPDDADIYYDLGTALTRLAQYNEAANAFSKSLEIDPEHYRAEDALEEAREGAKRISAGKKHQEDLLKKKDKEDDLKNANGEAPQPNSSTRPSKSKSNSNAKPKPTRKPGV